MAETKHTPGKWKLGEQVYLGDIVVTIIETEEHRIIGYAVTTPAYDEESLSNADLIAAAPEQQAKIDRLEAEKRAAIDGWKKAEKCVDENDIAYEILKAEKAELVEELKKIVANCDQCDEGEIEIERNQFTHGLNAYDGAGQTITDEVPCPYCGSARTALAKVEPK